MKQIIFLLVITLTALVAVTQTNARQQSPDYDAAKWETWLLENPQQITIAAPAATAPKSELQIVKQRLSNLDEKKVAAIKYWNAGAPAYRWNQILPELLAHK